jgi:hypothetical protein
MMAVGRSYKCQMMKEKGPERKYMLENSDSRTGSSPRAVLSIQASVIPCPKKASSPLATDSLVPFTRWVTPTNIPKRFTAQMYLAFLDLPRLNSSSKIADLNLPTTSEATIPTPTSDGGVEHTAALFAPCSTWLAQARANEIILFPPQFYLMHLLAPFLSPPQPYHPLSVEELQKQRDAVRAFLQTSNSASSVPWSQKVISPTGLFFRKSDGRSVLALDKPGQELEGSGRSGDPERVVLVKFSKEGPRDVEVRWRKDVLEEERRWKEKEGTKL